MAEKMPDRRMLALAVGVSDASPLTFLPGAINGARNFFQWAQALGYDARLLVDEEAPVTIIRLRQELEALLAGAPTHRLVLYFAGHGLIREAEEGLWLLSDWQTELRAVAVEALKRRLYRYGVGQIAIFADACRSLPRDMEAADLISDGVLGRGPENPPQAPPTDKFVASQDGTETFMIPGATPTEDRCLFSGVLLEGLWGARKEAFSQLVPGKVTSGSLGAYLVSRVPQVAARYNLKLFPTVLPTFPEGDNVYYGDGAPPAAPVLPAWPPAMRRSPAGPETGVSTDVELLGESDRALSQPSPGFESTPEGEARQELLTPSLHARVTSQHVPRSFDTQSGFVIDGQAVVALWTSDDEFAEVHGEANWWRLWRLGQQQMHQLTAPALVLIEFSSGLFAATTALPRFTASVICEERGVAALLYRRIHTDGVSEVTLGVSEVTLRALDRLESAGLRAAAATDLAIELRRNKFEDPVLGVICAYLYDSIGDMDSIRRMAYYYVQEGQAIPYDLAMLGQLDGSLLGAQLWAQVPVVGARAPRTATEKAVDWTHEATGPAEGVVAGFWPWLRQGWAFFDTADETSPLVVPGLLGLIPGLQPSRFTTLDERRGRELAALFSLQPRYAPAAAVPLILGDPGAQSALGSR